MKNVITTERYHDGFGSLNCILHLNIAYLDSEIIELIKSGNMI